ncbi:MAG: undecaprenyl-diphosphate phosphatase [Gemmatimonadales bacterium]|jgi:undecaprenyl-diphosphatase
MHDYLLSLALGVVEGVTEYLPVSSTAHLRISEALLGVNLGDGYWKMYTIVIQLGAICVLPIYFRARIAHFFRGFARAREEGRATVHPFTLTLVAFVVTAVPSLLLTKVIGQHLESLVVMGTSLVVGGVVMWVVDWLFARGRLRTHTPEMEQMTMGQAVWIGFCQIFSGVFPGTSRSMATIAGGQLAGMTRAAALEFSFFLSMPTMVAATGYDLYKTMREGTASALGGAAMTAHGWAVLVLGFVVSFVVAYGVVAWFISWVRRRGFVPFAVWRLCAGAAVLLWMTGGAR